jgi:PD-(D/E)XK endonuclease
MNPREQGDLGERAAMNWLWSKGCPVGVPIGHSPDFDLLTVWEGRAVTVQVKTSAFFAKARWCVMLATSGGNQSWNKVVKLYDPSRFDYLFAIVGDGRQWFIPSDAIDARRQVRLGGPKFEQFEVERGPRIPCWRAA